MKERQLNMNKDKVYVVKITRNNFNMHENTNNNNELVWVYDFNKFTRNEAILDVLKDFMIEFEGDIEEIKCWIEG
jgi:hypothetical protein